MNVEKLQQLSTYLKSLPPEDPRWDFGGVICRAACGYQGCALYHMTYAFPDEFYVHDDSVFGQLEIRCRLSSINGNMSSVFADVAGFFGLTHQEVSVLFDIDGYVDRNPNYKEDWPNESFVWVTSLHALYGLEPVTPQDVARQIDRFITWKLANPNCRIMPYV